MKLHKILIRRVLTACTIFAACASLASCSSDDAGFTQRPAGSDPDPNADSNTIPITISIPHIDFNNNFDGTRADPEDDVLYDPVNTSAGEGTLQSLYLAIFKKDPDYNNRWNAYLIEDIKSASTVNGAVSGLYNTDYRPKLEEGSYRFYLLGNIYEHSGMSKEQFEASLSKPETDQVQLSDIRKIVLKFTLGNIQATNIPMLCLHDEVLTSSDNNTYEQLKDSNGTPGVLEITKEMIADYQDPSKGGQAIILYAPMKLLCSKVRYTVLFNNTDETEESFSKSFPLADVHFTSVNETTGKGRPNGQVSFSNIYNQTTVLPLTSEIEHKSDDWSTSVTRTISQCKYPVSNDGNTEFYLDITNSNNVATWKTPSNLEIFETDDNADSWNPDTKRAWQGIVYLPENNVFTKGAEDEYQTVLSLTGTGTGVGDNGTKVYNIPLTLDRGHFYDIVMKLITSSSVKLEMKVSVNPWSFNYSEVSW